MIHSNVLSDYKEDLPPALVKALKPLANDVELALFVCILKEGPFTFTEIKEKYGFHHENLVSALDSLIKAGLIEKGSAISEDETYSSTALGKSILRSLIKGALFME
jgi:DNA-binding MarR family transcriptional regulator